MTSQDAVYSAKLFLNAVIPLFKVVALEGFSKNPLAKHSGIIQISVNANDETWATHFLLDNGTIKTILATVEDPDVELHFKSLEHFNGFFKNETKKLPKIKGFLKLGMLIATFKVLLKMAGVLSVTELPQDEVLKKLVTKSMFYLLTAGISQLNKLGHPDVSKWAKTSPDRVYALTVDNEEDLAAFIRVKAGNTKSSRGRYKRSKPFFTMRFADVDSALAILLETGDLLELTAEKKLIMEVAPEFGAKMGDFMMLVGVYVK